MCSAGERAGAATGCDDRRVGECREGGEKDQSDASSLHFFFSYERNSAIAIRMTAQQMRD
jgi:hypothetical protein